MSRSNTLQAVPIQLVPAVTSAASLVIVAVILTAALVLTGSGSAVESATTNRTSPSSRSIKVINSGSNIAPEGVGDTLQGTQKGLQNSTSDLQQPTSNGLQNAGGGGLNR